MADVREVRLTARQDQRPLSGSVRSSASEPLRSLHVRLLTGLLKEHGIRSRRYGLGDGLVTEAVRVALSERSPGEMLVAVRPERRPRWQQATYRLATVHDLEFRGPARALAALSAWVWCDEAADDNGDPLHVCDGDKHRVAVTVRRADNPHCFELLMNLAAA